MRKLTVIGFIFITALLMWQCTSFKVAKLSSNCPTSSNAGVVYSLPQTALTFDVEITKETRIKGPFADYAEKLLGLKNVIALTQTNYKVSKIGINSDLIPDTAHQYLINKRRFIFGHHAWHVQLDQFGSLLNLNGCKNKISDTVFSPKSFVLNSEITSYPNLFKLYADASQIEKIDTVYEMVKMDTIVMSKPIIKRTLVTKTLLQRAEEAADYILKFRLKRYELIAASQEIPYSKEALEFMNNQLVKMENDYLDLFTGITQTEVLKYKIQVVPTLAMQNLPIPLFGFSEEMGFLPYNDTLAKHYTLVLSVDNQIKTDTLIHKPTSLIPYRNPMQTRLSIFLDGVSLEPSRLIPILQFGNMRYLPRRVKSFSVDPNTGILRIISVK